MKIAIIAELNKPIQRDTFGGTEIWTYNFAEELIKRGHSVTIFARKESKTAAKLLSICKLKDLQGKKGEKLSRDKLNLYLTEELTEAIKLQDRFDIIHFSIFSFYLGLPFSKLITKPLVITIHGYCNISKKESKQYFYGYPGLHYVFPSKAFIKNWVTPKHYKIIHHGIDVNRFSLSTKSKDFYFWMSRLIEDKGILDAIEFAEKTGEKLIIGGNIDDPDFFNKKIKPRLTKKIKYVGELHFKQKIDYYKTAKALLFLPKIKEAFGLVAVEALACGTPVIAYDQDPLSEIISDGKNGYLVKTGSIKGLISASKKIDRIDSNLCRQIVVDQFSSERMVDEYLEYYKHLAK